MPHPVETAYNKIASEYDRDYTDNIHASENAEVARLTEPLLTDDPPRILDAGSGTGLLLDLFPGIPWHSYLGRDVSDRMIDEAKKKHPGHTFSHDDAWNPQRIELDPLAVFDRIISLFGACSYDRAEDVAWSVGKRLAGNGQFALMPYALGRLRTIDGRQVDQHHHLWQIRSAALWRSALEHEGLRNVQIRGFNLIGSARLLRWESIISNVLPDACQYLFITGEK
jgi:SAM-dependent methyltransferase